MQKSLRQHTNCSSKIATSQHAHSNYMQDVYLQCVINHLILYDIYEVSKNH